MKINKFLLGILLFALMTTVQAAAPVVEAGTNSDANVESTSNSADDGNPGSNQSTRSASSGSLESRVRQMENQMAALQEMNPSQQMNALKQKIADLQGKIEVLEHSVAQLQQQQKTFYADLDDRLTQLEGHHATKAKAAVKKAEEEISTSKHKEVKKTDSKKSLKNSSAVTTKPKANIPKLKVQDAVDPDLDPRTQKHGSDSPDPLVKD
jgi:TolA-binding protein